MPPFTGSLIITFIFIIYQLIMIIKLIYTLKKITGMNRFSVLPVNRSRKQITSTFFYFNNFNAARTMVSMPYAKAFSSMSYFGWCWG